MLWSGKTIKVYLKYTEKDKRPDIGENMVQHLVTEDDLRSGFTMKTQVTVAENAGPNRGAEAKFAVTISFKPAG